MQINNHTHADIECEPYVIRELKNSSLFLFQKGKKQVTKKLSDVLTGDGTNMVYISGTLDGRQIDCAGPIELTYKIDKPQWPFVPATSEYSPEGLIKPVFDYGAGSWVEQDENLQGKLISNLQNQVKELKKNLDSKEKENTALKAQISAVQQGQVQTTSILGQLMPAVQTLSQFAQTLQKKEGDK